jgi:hypothetical protein
VVFIRNIEAKESMKEYPTITKNIRKDIHIYAFDKLDGNNIRAEWSSKRGFYKFGSRNQLIDEKNKQFGEAVTLIHDKYESDLAMVFKENRWRDVICFFEYYGPSSFAGQHIDSEQKTVTLFDVNPYEEGILEPRIFIKLFGHLEIPKVLYEGKANFSFVSKVKSSALNGMTFEGCVCKGCDNGRLIMFKIKSTAWLNKLRDFCKNNTALYNKLE